MGRALPRAPFFPAGVDVVSMSASGSSSSASGHASAGAELIAVPAGAVSVAGGSALAAAGAVVVVVASAVSGGSRGGEGIVGTATIGIIDDATTRLDSVAKQVEHGDAIHTTTLCFMSGHDTSEPMFFFGHMEKTNGDITAGHMNRLGSQTDLFAGLLAEATADGDITLLDDQLSPCVTIQLGRRGTTALPDERHQRRGIIHGHV